MLAAPLPEHAWRVEPVAAEAVTDPDASWPLGVWPNRTIFCCCAARESSERVGGGGHGPTLVMSRRTGPRWTACTGPTWSAALLVV